MKRRTTTMKKKGRLSNHQQRRTAEEDNVASSLEVVRLSDPGSCQLSQWTRTTTRNRVLSLPDHNLPSYQRSHKILRRPSSFILLAYLFPVALTTTTSQETSTTLLSVGALLVQLLMPENKLLLNVSSAETMVVKDIFVSIRTSYCRPYFYTH